VKVRLVVAVAAALAVPAWLAAQGGAEYHVIAADMGWNLSANQKLRAGDTLSSKEANQDAIVDCKSAGWIAYTCLKPACSVQACSTAIKGGESRRVDPSGQTPARSLSDALFARSQTVFVNAAVRGGREPNDAVLMQDAQGVHWGPALQRVLEGGYCFRLARLPAAGTRPLIFSLPWDRRKDPEGVMAVPGVTPGTYALEKGAPDGSGCRVAADAARAWILIAQAAGFNRIDAQWKQDAAWADRLEESGASTLVVVTVRRALLASLADPPGRP
jgi:hypothetical protein